MTVPCSNSPESAPAAALSLFSLVGLIRRLSPFLLIFALLGLAIPASASSTVYTVTSKDDSSDSSHTCTNTSETCTLREAIELANANPGSTIQFASNVTGIITLGKLLPAISADMAIIGPGSDLLTISGNQKYKIFNITNGTIRISGLTLTKGYALYGGAINNCVGTLNLYDSVLVGNMAVDWGGAISNIMGTLNVYNSTIINNTSNMYAGAIYNDDGTTSIYNTTVAGNSALYGGGIRNFNATLKIYNSTFTSNTATSGGGISNSLGELTVVSSTFTGNSAGNGGGITNTTDSHFYAYNNILAGNTARTYGPDVNGDLQIDKSNVRDSVGLNLSALLNNGGPATMIPLPGSSVICAADPSYLDPSYTGLSSTITTDQRGFPRTNVSYTGYSVATPCMDAGAVQTHYSSVQWLQLPTATPMMSAISPAPSVEVFETNANDLNNTHAANGIPVTVTLLSNSNSGTLNGTMTQASTSGAARFNDLTLDKMGTYTLETTPITIVSSPNGTTVLDAVQSNFFEVTRMKPNVTWPTASSITYGQTLASSVLSGGAAAVAGSFAWNSPTIQPGIGTTSYSITFTPADVTTCESITGNVSVTTTDPGFTLSGSDSATQTVNAGKSAAYSFTLTPGASTFANVVTFSVSGLPSGASATFSPASIAAGSSEQTVTLTIATAATSAQKSTHPMFLKLSPVVLGLVLPAFGVATIRRRARGWICLGLLFGAIAVVMTSGCSTVKSSSDISAPPPPTTTTTKSYSVSVTAVSGAVNHSTVFTLNVVQ